MAGVSVGKGTKQPQNGFVDGLVSFTTEATTFSINVSTITDGTTTSFPNVTSVIHATVALNSAVTVASTIAQDVPICTWTTTDAIVKVTCDASQSTLSMSLRFVGK